MNRDFLNFYWIIVACLFFTPAESFASVSLQIKEIDSRFFSGENVERTIMIHPDSTKDEKLIFRWNTSIFNRVLQREEQVLNLRAHEAKTVKTNLMMPIIEKRTELQWTVELLKAGKKQLEHTYKYSVFPQSLPYQIKDIVRKKKIGLFDPNGDTRNVLNTMGILSINLESKLSQNAFEGDLVIIGSNAISGENINVLLDMESKVREGISVLCYEQKVLHDRFPMPLSLQSDEANKVVDSEILSRGHVIFSGLKAGDLSKWRSNGTIAHLPLRRLIKGNFRTLLEVAPSGETEMQPYPLLLEIPLGRGKFIFSQLLQVEKFTMEPIARLLFANLIRYGITKTEPMKQAKVYGSQQNEVVYLLKEIGLDRTYNQLRMDDAKKIIICSDHHFVDLIKRMDSSYFYNLRQILQKGGTLLIFNLIPEVADNLQLLFPTNVNLVESSTIENTHDISINSSSTLLWGIAGSDLQAIINHSLADLDNNPLYFLNFKKETFAMPLMQPCAIAKFKSGKGEIIVCQLRFSMDNDEASIRVLSQLLTNLCISIPPDK